MPDNDTTHLMRSQVAEFLEGGFAPVVILLREFHYDKAGIVLDGLHFSAWSLLGHMHRRQEDLLHFIKDTSGHPELWRQPYWPDQHQPENEQAWNTAIDRFEDNLKEMIRIVKAPDIDLYEVHENGKTLLWAAMANFQHNAYHIGQLKAIGRQLGVW